MIVVYIFATKFLCDFLFRSVFKVIFTDYLMETKSKIRQPIVTVCGHVDHGKTSILDCLRSSCIQEGEAGGITQKISFTSYPLDQLKKSCPLIERSGINLNIPGFLLIDTPGHAAFTNLRKRGGSLADLAVLVIDIMEGIKPQTSEVIQILKKNKTPFIIALNKIDKVAGWQTYKDLPLKEAIESQPMNAKQRFDELYMTLMGSLNAYGFEADLFYNIDDFTKKIAMVPTSAHTKQGIPELIMMICGLSEKFLKERLTLKKDAKGVILEVKKENSMNYAESILYDGELSKEREIAISDFEGKPIITKIRILEEIEPLSSKFKPKEKVVAATGLRLQLITKEEIPAGMPFVIYKDNLEEIKEQFKKDIGDSITSKLKKQGIIAKADSLGSLEALLVLLEQENIPVIKAGIGNVKKADIINAKANLEINELDAIIVGFNVGIEDDANEIKGEIKLIFDQVVYKLIENLSKYRKEKSLEIEKQRLMKLSNICKLEILHQYVFRNTSPAIFGVRVDGGKLKKDLHLIDETGEKIGRVKEIQHERKSVDVGNEGQELCISIPGINFERVLGDRKFLYADFGESQFREFKKNKDLLSEKEKKVLFEMSIIKRKEKEEWGI